jgi:hypothetical protein
MDSVLSPAKACNPHASGDAAIKARVLQAQAIIRRHYCAANTVAQARELAEVAHLLGYLHYSRAFAYAQAAGDRSTDLRRVMAEADRFAAQTIGESAR